MDKDINNTPSLVDALVTDIINDLPAEGLVSIADLDEDEFRVLELTQGRYIKYRLSQLSKLQSDELIKECRQRSDEKSMGDAGASVFILKEMWKRLT